MLYVGARPPSNRHSRRKAMFNSKRGRDFIKRTPRIGPEYQATIPDEKYDENDLPESGDELIDYSENHVLVDKLMDPLPFTIKEMELFIEAYKIHGKDFSKIKKNYLSERSITDIVWFYYYWKRNPEVYNEEEEARI
ncbi:hypothetical protein ACOME3_005531 [Neoechinorhynchus agilis]